MKKEYLYLIGAIVVLLALFGKQKTCQNSTSGDLKSVPWFWPCAKGSDSISSASTD